MSAVASSLTELRPGWAALAVAASMASMGFLARAQRRMLRAGGLRVSMPRMIGLTYAANALNWTLPGGSLLSTGYVVRQLRSWGATPAAAGFTVAASGVLSGATFAALAVVAGLLGGPGAGVSVVGALGLLTVAAVAAAVRRRRRASGAGAWVARAQRWGARGARLLRRDPEAGRAAVRAFVADVSAIRPRLRDWSSGLAFAAGNWLADLCCLFASCRAVGAGHTTTTLLVLAYVAGMTASSVSVVPGGIGVVDLAMIAALAAGGLAGSAATAVVVMYRVVSCALIVGAGWLVWLGIRVGAARSRRLARVAA